MTESSLQFTVMFNNRLYYTELKLNELQQISSTQHAFLQTILDIVFSVSV